MTTIGRDMWESIRTILIVTVGVPLALFVFYLLARLWGHGTTIGKNQAEENDTNGDTKS